MTKPTTCIEIVFHVITYIPIPLIEMTGTAIGTTASYSALVPVPLAWGLTAFFFLPVLWQLPSFPRGFLRVSRHGVVDGVLIGAVREYLLQTDNFDAQIDWNMVVKKYWQSQGELHPKNRLNNQFIFVSSKDADLGYTQVKIPSL